jgi:hypothetical protein
MPHSRIGKRDTRFAGRTGVQTVEGDNREEDINAAQSGNTT